MKLPIEASISKKWLESVNKRNSFYYITQNGLTDVNKNIRLINVKLRWLTRQQEEAKGKVKQFLPNKA